MYPGEIAYLLGKPVAHWASILDVMDRNRLEDAEQLSRWIDDHAAALLEEKSKNMKLEAQLLRIKNIVTK
jgi:hypothetical protein